MTRAAEAEWLERADAVLAEIPPAVRVRLPEILRAGKRVVREVQIRQFNGLCIATYAEHMGMNGTPFKPVRSEVCENGPIEAVLWGEGQGHAAAH